MFAIYRRLWQVNWAEQWQYRADLLLFLTGWLISPIIFMAVWTTVASAQGNVNGITAPEFAAYYLVLLLVTIATSDTTLNSLSYKIMGGGLSYQLVVPVHPVLTQMLVNNLASKALQMAALTPIWLILYLLFHPALAITPTNMLLALPAITMGFLLQFLANATITCLAFWTTRGGSIMSLYGTIFSFLSGQIVPLTLLPLFAQNAAAVLPFRLALYFPVQLILGTFTVEETLINLGLQLIWCLVLLVVFNLVWRAGLKRYSAVGA